SPGSRRHLLCRHHGHGRRPRRARQPAGLAGRAAWRHEPGCRHFKVSPVKLVILDRDGVINQDSAAFVKSPDEWIALPGSLEAIARLSQAGWRVVVASNQSGLARGMFSMETLNAIHAKMRTELAQAGGHIDSVFICPHGPDDGC